MTTLPQQTEKKLGLVIDLDTCVGCHACVISCKGWNTENYGAPLADEDAYGADPVGSFLNRVHSYEVQPAEGEAPRQKSLALRPESHALFRQNPRTVGAIPPDHPQGASLPVASLIVPRSRQCS